MAVGMSILVRSLHGEVVLFVGVVPFFQCVHLPIYTGQGGSLEGALASLLSRGMSGRSYLVHVEISPDF